MLAHFRLLPHTIIAIALLLITLSVNIAMPLFSIYAEAAGFNKAQTVMVFSSYILGMLPCYIFFGGLSDKVGRKPVVLVCVLIACTATGLITVWPNVFALIISRLLQGIAVGLGIGACTAYISELLYPYPDASSKAAAISSVFTAFGFGGGALATSLALYYNFTLLPITYYLLLVATVIGSMLLITVPATKPLGGKIMRLPHFPPETFTANAAISICWAATGITIAIIPIQLAKFGLSAYSGICLVLINWTGAFIQPLIREIKALKAIKTGLVLIPLGFVLIIIGCSIEWIFLIFIGAAIVGMAAYGFCYLGGLTLVTNATSKKKARAVSAFMLCGYFGFGFPAIGLGYFADYFGIINSLLLFEAFSILMCLWIIIGIHRKNTYL